MKTKGKTRRIAVTGWQDRVMYAFTDTMLVIIFIIIAYPLIYVLSSSFSSGPAVSAGRVVLWPVDFTLNGYRIVFSYKSVWTGFANSLFYTVAGATFDLLLTVLAAYPLSRPDFKGRKFYTTLFLITMLFSAGLIPKYILMVNLRLTNTRWALILAGAFSTYRTVVMRTFFKVNIPGELFDSAKIDGCSEFRCLTKIVLPLSHAIIAVTAMFAAVANWNTYFTAIIYLRKPELLPLQVVLREVLVAQNVDLTQITDAETLAMMTGSADVMKFSLIVVTTVPIVIIYPFIQKYFQKGVMIGSVKG